VIPEKSAFFDQQVTSAIRTAPSHYVVRILTWESDAFFELSVMETEERPRLLADLNGDGWGDLVLTRSYALGNGDGTFVLPATPLPVDAAVVRDFNRDGAPDVLVASDLDSKIAWYENEDAAGTLGPQRVVSLTMFGANFVRGVDIDDDGDVDLLASSIRDDRIAWFENLNGEGDFGAAIGNTVTAGWDTDCNGATVGGLIGLSGVPIPDQWTRPWRGRIGVDLAGIGEVRLDDVADRTVAVARSLAA